MLVFRDITERRARIELEVARKLIDLFGIVPFRSLPQSNL